MEPQVAWQGALFDSEPDGGRLSFAGVRRDALDATSWVELVPGWLPEHAEVFDLLLAEAPWRQREREMWDARVLEPRLVAVWPVGAALPGPVAELAAVLSDRYGVAFDSCLVNLYRDGSDAVAWHGDTVRKVQRDPLVATVSLGAARSFLLRSAAGGPVVRRYRPGGGDLVVMGGACQHDFVHTVPRERTASGARMSITLRHSRPRR